LEILIMAGVKANIDLSISATQEGTADLGTPSINVAVSRSHKYTNGTLATDQTDVLFSDRRTLAASANEDLDLRGTLVDSLGQTINPAEIVAVFVEAASTNTNNVIVGGAATNTWVGPFGAATHTLSLAPGEFILLSNKAGWGVTAGTGDLLRIANSAAGSSVNYNIIIIGRSAAA
jgi:hypothetical protein